MPKKEAQRLAPHGDTLEDSEGPDTEIASPPTPVPPTQSIDRASSKPSALSSKSESPKTQVSAAAKKQPASSSSARSSGEALTKAGSSHFSPVSAGISPSHVSGHVKERPSKEGGNTTLQSMRRPESAALGVPHTRRFLSIERELEQSNASVKLLEKRLRRVEKLARIALSAALLSFVALLLARSL